MLARIIVVTLNLLLLAGLVYGLWRVARGIYRLVGRIPAVGHLVAASSPTVTLGDCPSCGGEWIGWLSGEWCDTAADWSMIPVWSCMVDLDQECGSPDRLERREPPPIVGEGIDPTVSHAELAVLRAYTDDEVPW